MEKLTKEEKRQKKLAKYREKRKQKLKAVFRKMIPIYLISVLITVGVVALANRSLPIPRAAHRDTGKCIQVVTEHVGGGSHKTQYEIITLDNGNCYNVIHDGIKVTKEKMKNLQGENIVIYYDIVNDNELTGLYGTRRITRLESAEGHLYFGEVAIYFSTVFFRVLRGCF